MEPVAQVDLIANGQASGNFASQLLTMGKVDPGMLRPYIGKDGKVYVTVFKGGDPKKPENYASMPMQINATLRRDEWKQLDDAILPIAESRLNAVQDLIDNGLTYNLGNAMGTTVLEWHDISDAMEADMTMDGISRSRNDRPNYTSKYLPIPIIHVDYEINARVLSASRSLGNPLDTTSAERAARKVAEKLESLLFNTGTSYAFGGGSIPSYLNYTDRNQVSMGTHWDDEVDSQYKSKGEKIIVDVLAMKQASINDHFYGPWMIYVPTAYETLLDEDYDNTGGTNSGTTIRDRILKISGIKGIKVADGMPADNVVMVQMTSDVVRLVRGMGIQNIQWEEEGKMITKYKVMTIQVPQIRSDQDGRCGIIHLA